MEMKDTFKILIASDVHLGFMENDPIRGQDSFNTFEEILEEANKNDVDFILLGGDLFHDSKPSIHCLHRCMSLLRRYCLGHKSISFNMVSDQAENFRHCVNPQVNYEDPHIYISIPIFSIHGNHDDPSGNFHVSSLDLLSVSGLLNYFGKCSDLTKIDITPLLFTKGATKLAIYGLSYIKDERLARLFKDKKVQMDRTKQDTEDWFNIFVCHQNRVDRGVNKYLPEEAFPKFLNLILWGHEHECRIMPEQNSILGFYVIQPGSPVATSLCEAEAKPKYIGILEIKNKGFKLKAIALKTVRPFIFDSISLSECNVSQTNDNLADNVQNYLAEKIETCIAEVARLRTGHKKQPKEPLIRLRVEYQDENQCFNTIRFGQNYQRRVANPTDIILMRKQKVGYSKNMKHAPENLQDLLEIDEGSIWDIKMETVIEQYFKEASRDKQLQLFTTKEISEAAANFIDKQEKDAFEQLIKNRTQEMQLELENSDISTDELVKLIENMGEMKTMRPDIEHSVTEDDII